MRTGIGATRGNIADMVIDHPDDSEVLFTSRIDG